MPYVAPPVYSSSNGYGFADVNRTNDNVTYLREETATFNGAKTFTNNITQTAGVTILKQTTITGGFLGIGTFAPTRPLEIISTLSNNILGVFQSTGAATNSVIAFSDPTSTFGQYSTRIGSIGDGLGFYTSGSTLQMNIFDTGNVGIGNPTDNLTDLLQIGGSASITGGLTCGGVTSSVDLSLSQGDLIDSRSINYYVTTNIRAEIEFERYIASGQGTRINFKTMGLNALTLDASQQASFSSNVSITGALTVDNIAQTSVWSAGATYARWGHKDFNLSNGYGYLQNSAGALNIECPVGSAVSIGVAAGANATFSGNNMNMSGNINPTTTPTSGTWTVNTTIPRGQYNYTVTTAPSAGNVEIYNSATLMIGQLDTIADGGSFYSDGTNVSINFDSATGGIITYWKY